MKSNVKKIKKIVLLFTKFTSLLLLSVSEVPHKCSYVKLRNLWKENQMTQYHQQSSVEVMNKLNVTNQGLSDYDVSKEARGLRV
ncbi:hypothetical protein LSPH24S_08782 [Lysinibacillus sphaericus]